MAKPTPKANEVLIKIHATTVVIEDPDMRASPGFNGFLKPRHPILGQELAGEIESIGKDVTQFKPGDQVFGFDMFGAYYKDSLKPTGIYLTTIPTLEILPDLLGLAKHRGKNARFMATGLQSASAKIQDLLIIKELVEAGKFKPVIDRCYPLEQIVEAHRYVATGHKKGNVVITT